MLTVGQLTKCLLDLKQIGKVSDDTPVYVYDNEEADELIRRIEIDGVRRDREIDYAYFCGIIEFGRSSNPCVLLDINK